MVLFLIVPVMIALALLIKVLDFFSTLFWFITNHEN